MFTQSTSGPLTKMYCTFGVDSITNRDNGIKIIVFQVSLYLSLTLLTNY